MLTLSANSFTHSPARATSCPNRLGRTTQAIQKVKSLFETSNWQTDGPGRVFFMKPDNPIGSFIWDCALQLGLADVARASHAVAPTLMRGVDSSAAAMPFADWCCRVPCSCISLVFVCSVRRLLNPVDVRRAVLPRRH